MGFFKAKDPLKSIYTASNGRIMARDIDATSMKYLWLIGFSAEPNNNDVRVANLPLEKMTPAFHEFMKTFLEQFNRQFPNAARTKVNLDYVALPEWPNYNIAKSDRPSQIGQSQFIEHNFEGDPISQKKTSLVIFMDGNKVGKFFALRRKNGGAFMEEIVDLKVSMEDEIGMALWSVSPTLQNVYSSLFLDLYWTAGENSFDKILLGIPTRQAALPFGMALTASGLK
jgi:hypothetical protein